jgi:hypothetical protein
LTTRSHIEDLGAAVAARRHIIAVVTEAHTTDHAFVLQGMQQLDIENARNGRVKYGKPLITFSLLMSWQHFRQEVG